MTNSNLYSKTSIGMNKSIEYLEKELRGIRTGRASTALIEYLKVDYYGSPTDLRELGAISIPEAQQILIKPFDPAAKNEISKTIESSNLGLNPQIEGEAIRVNVPAPSQDRRKQLANQVSKLAEETKIALRNERRDAIKIIESQVKKSELSEDQGRDEKDAIDSLTKEKVSKVEQLANKKTDEITTI